MLNSNFNCLKIFLTSKSRNEMDMKIQEDGKEERKSKFDQVTNSVLAVVQE